MRITHKENVSIHKIRRNRKYFIRFNGARLVKIDYFRRQLREAHCDVGNDRDGFLTAKAIRGNVQAQAMRTTSIASNFPFSNYIIHDVRIVVGNGAVVGNSDYRTEGCCSICSPVAEELIPIPLVSV